MKCLFFFFFENEKERELEVPLPKILSLPWLFTLLIQWIVSFGLLAIMRVECYLNASIRFCL